MSILNIQQNNNREHHQSTQIMFYKHLMKTILEKNRLLKVEEPMRNWNTSELVESDRDLIERALSNICERGEKM